MPDNFIEQLEKDISSPRFALADKMLELMSDGKTRYSDEIASILNVDIIDVIEVFNILREEGKLYHARH